MLSLSAISPLSFAPTGPAVAPATRMGAPVMETISDLKTLAQKSNPALGFWDPLRLSEYDQFQQGEEAAIGFLRHAEIKHGRVAMAGFVGYCIQANGICFPWKLTGETSFADIAAAGGPADQWDALPSASKLQILGFIAFLELWGESQYVLAQDGQTHYMRGGKPGFFPSLKKSLPHPVPFDLFDPFGFQKNLSAEKKAEKLVVELNNGRLAMIGIMGLVSASKGLIVPGLDTIGLKPYAGEVMAPFAAGDVNLPYVGEMMKWSLF